MSFTFLRCFNSRALIWFCALVCCGLVCGVQAREEAKERDLAESLPLVWQDKTPAEDKSSWTWQLLGHHDFTYWGLSIYKANLWLGSKLSETGAPFNVNGLARTPWGLPQGVVALHLVYQRGFSKEVLVKRSLEEMMAQHVIPQGQGASWERELLGVLPNVGAQDELLAIYEMQDLGRVVLMGKPKGHSSFEPLGRLSDPLLALSFMGIWLSPQTSQPKMREALLGQGLKKIEARE